MNKENNTTSAENHGRRGGTRPGAGRKPGKEKKTITIRIDVDLYEKLPCKKAKYIEQLIRKDLS